MTPTIIACPECQAKLKISAALEPGKKIRCPRCQATFSATGDGGMLPATGIQEEALRIPPPLPHQGFGPSAGPEANQAETRSYHGPAVRRARADDEDYRSSDRYDDEDDEFERRPKRRGTRTRKAAQVSPVLLWSVIGGGSLLVIGGMILLVLLLNAKSPTPAANGPAPAINFQGGGGGPGVANPGLAKNVVQNPALLAQLGPETAVQNYRIRPPRTFRLFQQQTLQGKLHVAVWQGPQRANLSAPALAITLAQLGPLGGDLNLQNFDQFKTGFRGSFGGTINFGPPELRAVNGITFIHCTISGTKNGMSFQGFLYVAKDGNNVVSVNFIDPIPGNPQDASLAHAAAQTLRRG